MLTKTEHDEIESFFSDASNMRGGSALRVSFPETVEEVSHLLAEATRTATPVTIAGAGTGIVGGRVPFGGIVLATSRLNKIKEIVCEESDAWAIAEAGVVLADFQRAVSEKGLIYPPDPTEWSCYLGGTVATNASGARTFKYGATRNFIRRLKIALATGNIIDLRRGQVKADGNGLLHLPLPGGGSIEAHLPSYNMPRTRKHAAGYFVAPQMDAIDLFIGSEGTLGVILEIEVSLLPKPEGVLSGVVFFKTETGLLRFVSEARIASLRTRAETEAGGMDARALEFFDAESLRFLRSHYTRVPIDAAGAIFFEQETTAETEEGLQAAWLELLERGEAMLDDSWFATT